MRASVRDEAFFRLGASVLGLFAGAVIGLLLFGPLVAFGILDAPLPGLAFAGAVAGAGVGVFIPDTAVLAFEGVIHFFSGVLIALAGGDPVSSQDVPLWLRSALWVGVLYFGGVWLVLHVYALFAKYPL